MTLETVLRDAKLRSALRRGDVEALCQLVLDDNTEYRRTHPPETGMTLEEFIRWPLGETFTDDDGNEFTFEGC